ncbi:hypothetical protein [uncultured Flavobacterium sp.]|uniref:hypothetical protein n=1 Tax=uncultured Flavobacterium sp. TaxID=165435 RepID=UPI0030C7FD6C
MKKIYVLMAIIFMSIASTSCTTDSVIEETPTQYATGEGDTGGQNGTLPPPPPTP